MFSITILKKRAWSSIAGAYNPRSLQPPSKIFLAIIFSIILRKWILHFINNISRGVSDGKVLLLLDVLILGPWEMATGEWNNIKIIDGFFERKMGSFFKGWSYVCSNGYG